MDIETHSKKAIHENDSEIGNSDVVIVGSPDDVDDDDDVRQMFESELVNEVPEPTLSRPPAERGAIFTMGGSVEEPCAKRSRTTKPEETVLIGRRASLDLAKPRQNGIFLQIL